MKHNDYRPLIPVNPQGLDEIADALLRGENSNSNAGSSSATFPVSAPIQREKYVLIPQHSMLIGKREEYLGLQWQPTLEKLAEKQLFMPSLAAFMTHVMNVKSAAEGKGKLYDGNQRLLPQIEVQELWNYLSSTDRSPFQNKTCWTWIDALFKKNAEEKIYLETDHRIFTTAGKVQLAHRDVSLSPYLQKDGLVNLAFTREGLATQESAQNSYVQGQNMYFWYPRENCVAGFGASSDWAGLFCYWNPTSSNSDLGVFPCAAGAMQKNGGTS